MRHRGRPPGRKGARLPCQEAVFAQWDSRVDASARAARWPREHQLPEPWSGDLEGARILVVSSNPGAARNPIGPGPPASAAPPAVAPQAITEHPTLAQGSRYPRSDFDDDQIVDYFHNRFERFITESGRHRRLDGEPGHSQPFWRTVIDAACEIVPSLRPGADLALTELVHCKTPREGRAMPRATPVCVGRYLGSVLELSGARIVFAVGMHAWRELGVARGQLRGPISLGGRPRYLVGLLHPAGFGRPKRPSEFLGSDDLARLRAFVGGDAADTEKTALEAPPPTVRAPKDARPIAAPSSRPRFDAYRDTPGGGGYGRQERRDFRLVICGVSGSVIFDDWRRGVTYARALGKLKYNARELRKQGLDPARLVLLDEAGRPIHTQPA